MDPLAVRKGFSILADSQNQHRPATQFVTDEEEAVSAAKASRLPGVFVYGKIRPCRVGGRAI